MIKLIALDLDNTLLEKNNKIHPKSKELLRQCVEKDIIVVIATGRLFYSAKKYADEIGPACKILCYNGSLITDGTGEILYCAELSSDVMMKIVQFCKKGELYCQFYSEHKILVEKVTDGTMIDPDLENTEAIEVGCFDNYQFLPSPKAMIVVKPEQVSKYQKELVKFLGEKIYIAQSQPYLIEIMPDGVNKAQALKVLCDSLDIQQSEVMACGDNTNDAEMVEWAGTGIAVANSVNSLKKVASYVCQNERSLGVAEAIEKFCL